MLGGPVLRPVLLKAGARLPGAVPRPSPLLLPLARLLLSPLWWWLLFTDLHALRLLCRLLHVLLWLALHLLWALVSPWSVRLLVLLLADVSLRPLRRPLLLHLGITLLPSAFVLFTTAPAFVLPMLPICARTPLSVLLFFTLVGFIVMLCV
jgi:hypothetical protein